MKWKLWDFHFYYFANNTKKLLQFSKIWVLIFINVDILIFFVKNIAGGLPIGLLLQNINISTLKVNL